MRKKFGHKWKRRIYYDEIKKLKWGKTFWECCYGKCEKFKIFKEPIDKNNKLEWQGKSFDSNDIIHFMITKNLDHYGPKIYIEKIWDNEKEEWINP